MKTKYIIKRILIIIPTFVGITIFAYFIMSLAPGTPLDYMLASGNMSAQEYEAMIARYGLDQPVFIQYFNWFVMLLQGNFGVSFRSSQAVLPTILERVGPTLSITLTSMAAALLLAVPLGCLAALKPSSVIDYTASGLSFVAAATPNFFLGLVLIYLFAVNLGWLPASGMYTSAASKEAGDYIRHMIMPAMVLAVQQIGSYIRQVRGSMLEALKDDHVRTARSKGIRSSRIVVRHALRNALIPLVTTVGMQIPFIVGGAVVTEQIFGWPGIGTLMIMGIRGRDYPVIMGITVFISIVVLIGNLLTDLLYGILDPRISYK